MSNAPQYSAEEPLPPTGMSGTTKVLLGLGLGCGFLMLLACGGMCISFYYLQSYIKEAVTQDPAKIRTLTSDIVDIEIPANLEPKLAFNPKDPFSKAPLGIAVVYGDEKDKSMLMLIEIQVEISDKQKRDQIQRQIEDGVQQQGHGQQRQFKLEEAKPHETTIHSEPAKFTIAKGHDPSNKQKLWQVTGEFKGTEGPAIFLFRAPQDSYTEEQIIEMLDSMK